MTHLKIIVPFIMLLLALCNHNSQAEEINTEKKNQLRIEVKAKANKEKLSLIQTWVSDFETPNKKTVSTRNRSDINFDLDFNKKYEIIIKPEGYLQKKFVVDTYLPSYVKEGNDKFPPFEVTLIFYKEVPSINSNTYKNSLGEIAYDAQIDNFSIHSYVREFQPQQKIESAYQIVQKFDVSKHGRNEIIEQGKKYLKKKENYTAFLLFKLAKDSSNNSIVEPLIQQSNIEIEKDDQFAVRMLQANNHYQHKNYEEAATLYAEAAQIKPEYNYARQQLVYLEKEEHITPQNLEIDQNTDSDKLLIALNEVEKSLMNNDVTLASQQYFDIIKEMSVTNSKQTQFRIQSIGEEINKIVFGEEWMTLEVKFNRLLDEASDKAMAGKLEESRNLYLEAKATGYSKKGVDIDLRIKRIESMISRMKRTSEREIKEKEFNNYSAKARQLASRGDFEGAKIYYTKAKDLNLTENTYNVDSKLIAINAILESPNTKAINSNKTGLAIYSDAEIPDSNNKEELYKYYVNYGDRAFLENKNSSARFYFLKALDIKPAENYPRTQLHYIKKQVQLNLNAKSDKEYNDLIEKADKAIAEKNWSTAKFYLSKASELKPEESYPKVQKKKIRDEALQ